jgi:Uma2 family endonuclease
MTAMTSADAWTWPLRLSPDGWTVDDLQLFPDEWRHVELVDGALHVNPPPVSAHDLAATELAFLLHGALDRSWAVTCPGGIEMDRHNYRTPDVLVRRRSVGTKKYVEPSDVLLAVEVMSPGSITEDRVVKPLHYARAGIPHYWRLELDEQELVTYALAGEAYVENGRFDGRVEISEPVSVTFDLSDLLA